MAEIKKTLARAYLLKDGKPTKPTPDYVSTVQTACLILSELMPAHTWEYQETEIPNPNFTGPKPEFFTSEYGDKDRVATDCITLKDILARQGSSLLIDAIAEHASEVVNKFKLTKRETDTLRMSLSIELERAIDKATT